MHSTRREKLETLFPTIDPRIRQEFLQGDIHPRKGIKSARKRKKNSQDLDQRLSNVTLPSIYSDPTTLCDSINWCVSEEEKMSGKNRYVYRFFEKAPVEQGKKGSRWRCKTCLATFSRNLANMERHIAGCTPSTQPSSGSSQSSTQSSQSSTTSSTKAVRGSSPVPHPSAMQRRSVANASATVSSRKRKSLKAESDEDVLVMSDNSLPNASGSVRKKAQSFLSVSRLTKLDMLRGQKLFARLFYTGNYSFNSSELIYWEELLSVLNPSFVKPTMYQMRNTLLDEVYKEDMERRDALLNAAEHIAWAIDTWKDTDSTSKMNIIACIPKPVFVDTIDLDLKSLTSQLLYDTLMEVITPFGLNKVCAIISDNGSNIKKLRDGITTVFKNLAQCIVQGNQLPPVVYSIYCLCHSLNLMLSDLFALPSIKPMVQGLMFFIGRIKKNGKLRDAFRRAYLYVNPDGGNPPSLMQPTLIRWKYFEICLRQGLTLKDVFILMLTDKDVKAQLGSSYERVTFLDKDDTWKLFEILKDFVSFFSRGIDIGQRVDCNLSDAFDVYINIKSHLPNLYVDALMEEFEGLQNKLENRLNDA